VLDSGNFVDIELSTMGLSRIRSATLAVEARSTSSTGSFSWQTFVNPSGAAITRGIVTSGSLGWYLVDVTADFEVGKNELLRIKAGPPSNALVVRGIELCMEAD
jgi:hypothetical protein